MECFLTNKRLTNSQYIIGMNPDKLAIRTQLAHIVSITLSPRHAGPSPAPALCWGALSQ